MADQTLRCAKKMPRTRPSSSLGEAAFLVGGAEWVDAYEGVLQRSAQLVDAAVVEAVLGGDDVGRASWRWVAAAAVRLERSGGAE